MRIESIRPLGAAASMHGGKELDHRAGTRRRGLGRWTGLALLLMAPLAARGQETLSNGGNHFGSVAAGGEAQSWTFAVNSGDAIMLRVGATNFTPRIRLFAADNTPAGEVSPSSSLARDAFLTAQAAGTGSYTVLVSAAFPNQSGSYGLRLAVAPAAFEVPPGDEGGALVNGAANEGTILLGDLDLWSFTADAGASIMLRAGGPSFSPWIRLYGPDGALVEEASASSTLNRDGFLTAQATNSGVYTVVVSAGFAGQTGGYGLHLALAPAAVVVSPGDEGGPLENGAANEGTIAVGDLDVWSFNAESGNSIMLRMGGTGFTPWIRLYGPDGALVEEASASSTLNRDAFLTVQASQSGAYTVVVSAAFAGQTGDYGLHLAVAPGAVVVSPEDEGGPLENGAANEGTIAVGDLDAWSFNAESGNSIMLRMGGTGFTPWIRLYGPDGALVEEARASSTLNRDAFLAVQASQSGAYTVVVSAAFAGQTGDYGLHLALAPGAFVVSAEDEGGPLENGAFNSGTILVGDLDLWSFAADTGNSIMLRVGGTNFTPWIRLYGPDGALVEEVSAASTLNRDGFLTAQATNSGAYTVVVSAVFAGQTGGYGLHLALAPGAFVVSEGDEGGNLQNGRTNACTLTLGDLDLWSFEGTPGDSNVFRVASASFAPWIRLYGPEGGLVGESRPSSSVNRNTALNYPVTNGGPYLVVVSAAFAGQSGSYTFKQSRVAPDLILPETTSVNEAASFSASISAQDPDEPFKPLVFALITAPPGMTLETASPTNAVLNWTTSEADGPGTNLVTATVTDIVDGRPFVRTNSFALVVHEINTAPVLTVPNDLVVDELAPWSAAASATDSDVPANDLTFSLAFGPEGMSIDPASGAISWTPSELQGPSTNEVAVVVTDSNPPAVNAVALSATNTFAIVVREVNSAPVLPAQTARTLDELETLVVPNTGTDADVPANSLTYSLIGAPEGAVIDSNGVITWTPSEAQGPSTNTLITVVRDDGTPALSATNTVTVIVREVNTAPELRSIPDQSVRAGSPLSVQAEASDADLPANSFTFTIDQAPNNLAVDATSGLITWTPDPSQAGVHSLTLRVTDDGSPALEASLTFRVTVSTEETRLEIQRLASRLMQIMVHGDVGFDYELQSSADLEQWGRLFEFRLSTSPFPYIDPDSEQHAERFYRLNRVGAP